MQRHLKLSVGPALMIVLLLGTACAGSAAQSPTQTPVFVVIPGETPAGSPTTPEAAFPTPLVCRAEIVEQSFENGRMFWVGATLEERCKQEHDFTPGSGEIWVAIFDESGLGGEWLVFVDDWDELTDPPYDITLSPPPGLIQPVRGFGKVWRERLTEEQREAIGWATSNEYKFVTDYRYEAGGYIDPEGVFVPRPGLHMLVSLGGERFFFDEPSQTFDYIPAE
ncbi:MAG TPA: hypothetical protein ENI95_09345 [Chloroflexi bacterium]|nr:hypothetical protein [Chloroflexota bacterium]